jgi:hypothetical protein
MIDALTQELLAQSAEFPIYVMRANGSAKRFWRGGVERYPADLFEGGEPC